MRIVSPRVACVVLVSGMTALSVHAAADLSSPKTAFRSYSDAITAGDYDGAKSMVSADDAHLKMLKGQFDYNAIEKRFHAAADKAFPGASTQPNDFAKKLHDSTQDADVKVDGDTASLTTSQTVRSIQLKKDAGNWKVDLNQMYPAEVMAEVVQFRKALADVMDAMTPQIEAGKYHSYNEVKSDLEVRLKMRLATPSESGSTQPSL